MDSSYDFLVIGGGSAGYAAARTAHDLGMRVAVVDGARELGGLCILRGCMPSKTLIESANRFRSMRRAEEFGLRASGLEVRPEEIRYRKRRLIREFAEYRAGQLEDGRFDLHRATARFVDGHHVRIDPLDGGESQTLSFKSALVATGSTIARPPVDGLEETGYWTSDDALDADTLPDSVVVLGGGAIALELACYFEGMGKEVTVIQRGKHVLSGTDTDIAAALETALRERENLTLFTGTRLLKTEKDATTGRKTVAFEWEGGTRNVSADQILLATGRRPNTAGLDAPAAGIDLAESSGAVLASDQQRTSAPHIFAAGDVCGPHEVVHIAIEQGEIAAQNAAALLGFSDAPPRSIDYRLKLLGIFTDPE
ncbi:MAG TPA: NAD(P)/FAD-dependent oxidoreductase, partial [Bacteroidia bacterium]|nr:NAD(P)/FAD-dependent oxidoreductase [Bacteroidia bacterium]